MARAAIAGLLMAAVCACSSGENIDVELQRAKDVAAERRNAKEASGLTVTLPKAPSTDIDVTRESLVIMLPATGDAVVAGTTVPDDDLDNLFRAAFLKDKGTQVVIQADRGVAHGRVYAIMQKAKAAGLTRLAIGTTSH